MNARIILTALAFLALCALSNIIIGWEGVKATPYVAFLVVGPILVLRDSLHEAWAGLSRAAFALRIGLLVAAGALVAYLAVPGAAGEQVALASLAAFAASLTADTVVYALLRRAAEHVRVNLSNAVSAAVDSIVFIAVLVNLSAFKFGVAFAQFSAKVAGGALFLALVGGYLRERRARNERVAA